MITGAMVLTVFLVGLALAGSIAVNLHTHYLLKRLIEIFTDEGDIIIDPCAGSGATLRAAREMNRNAYGFEISHEFYSKAVQLMLA